MFLIFVIRLSWSNVKKNVNLNLSQNFVRFSLIISYKDDKTYRAMSIMSLDKEGWSRFDTAHFSSKFSWQTILRIGWEVRIKSIHNIGYKTAFYTSLYLLLSDSIQNILITFWPDNACLVSFKGQRVANSQYIRAFRPAPRRFVLPNFTLHSYKTKPGINKFWSTAIILLEILEF